jgi:hypothetical protein
LQVLISKRGEGRFGSDGALNSLVMSLKQELIVILVRIGMLCCLHYLQWSYIPRTISFAPDDRFVLTYVREDWLKR